MSMFNALEKQVLDHLFGNSTWVAPTNIYVALSTTTPNEDGTGITEPVGNGYARVLTSAADWNAAVTGDPTVIDNLNPIGFPQASGGAWGLITHWVLYDALTGGAVQSYAPLDTSKAIGDGDTASFAAGDLNMTLE